MIVLPLRTSLRRPSYLICRGVSGAGCFGTSTGLVYQKRLKSKSKGLVDLGPSTRGDRGSFVSLVNAAAPSKVENTTANTSPSGQQQSSTQCLVDYEPGLTRFTRATVRAYSAGSRTVQLGKLRELVENTLREQKVHSLTWDELERDHRWTILRAMEEISGLRFEDMALREGRARSSAFSFAGHSLLRPRVSLVGITGTGVRRWGMRDDIGIMCGRLLQNAMGRKTGHRKKFALTPTTWEEWRSNSPGEFAFFVSLLAEGEGYYTKQLPPARDDGHSEVVVPSDHSTISEPGWAEGRSQWRDLLHSSTPNGVVPTVEELLDVLRRRTGPRGLFLGQSTLQTSLDIEPCGFKLRTSPAPPEWSKAPQSSAPAMLVPRNAEEKQKAINAEGEKTAGETIKASSGTPRSSQITSRKDSATVARALKYINGGDGCVPATSPKEQSTRTVKAADFTVGGCTKDIVHYLRHYKVRKGGRAATEAQDDGLPAADLLANSLSPPATAVARQLAGTEVKAWERGKRIGIVVPRHRWIWTDAAASKAAALGFVAEHCRRVEYVQYEGIWRSATARLRGSLSTQEFVAVMELSALVYAAIRVLPPGESDYVWLTDAKTAIDWVCLPIAEVPSSKHSLDYLYSFEWEQRRSSLRCPVGTARAKASVSFVHHMKALVQILEERGNVPKLTCKIPSRLQIADVVTRAGTRGEVHDLWTKSDTTPETRPSVERITGALQQKLTELEHMTTNSVRCEFYAPERRKIPARSGWQEEKEASKGRSTDRGNSAGGRKFLVF